MTPNNYDILDTEIRIIGDSIPAPQKPKRRTWLIATIIIGLIASIIVLCLIIIKHSKNRNEVGIFEQTPVHNTNPHPLRAWITSLDSISTIGVVTKDTIVNDIPLRLYVPLNCSPRLEIGYTCIDDTSKNILVFQAADIRADNLEIVGAFVLRGEPLSWGLSKKGYCGIIEDQVTIGVADNSPLFELATEKAGYFFRQYPLVSNGYLVENELKSKSLRRGLCEIDGKIVVVASQTKESLHDFAQALVDIGTSQAIYLVGSAAMGWYRDTQGVGYALGNWEPREFENISFIVWSKP